MLSLAEMFEGLPERGELEDGVDHRFDPISFDRINHGILMLPAPNGHSAYPAVAVDDVRWSELERLSAQNPNEAESTADTKRMQ